MLPARREGRSARGRAGRSPRPGRTSSPSQRASMTTCGTWSLRLSARKHPSLQTILPWSPRVRIKRSFLPDSRSLPAITPWYSPRSRRLKQSRAAAHSDRTHELVRIERPSAAGEADRKRRLRGVVPGSRPLGGFVFEIESIRHRRRAVITVRRGGHRRVAALLPVDATTCEAKSCRGYTSHPVPALVAAGEAAPAPFARIGGAQWTPQP